MRSEIWQERRDQRDLLTKGLIENLIPDNTLLAKALRDVNRRLFTPLGSKNLAYQDRIIRLTDASTISQPSLVVKMIDLMGLTGVGKVLDVGTASGYTAALLSKCATQVYSIEYNQDLAGQARKRLQRLGYQNVEVVESDGTLGLPEQAPFDAILVSAAAKEMPPALTDQNRQLYDAAVSLVGLKYRVSYLEDKYAPYEVVVEKYKQQNQDVPNWVRDVRNPQSFNFSQFTAYQYVLQNQAVFKLIPKLQDKIFYFQSIHNHAIILPKSNISSGSANFRPSAR